MAMAERDYASCALRVRGRIAPDADRSERMRAVVEVLWEHLRDRGTAWLGFYSIAAARDAMTLDLCTPKPACSPIGLHGVCGRAWRERAPQVVGDVHALGQAHIVCDPANRSEVVVPCLDKAGECWGVLDLDSREPAAYTAADADGLRAVLLAAGLTF